MIAKGIICAAATSAALSAAAQPVSVPSGHEMALFDVIFEESPDIARFRFVAPGLAPDGAGLLFEDVLDDLDHLCMQVVLPALVAADLVVPLVVISLSEQETAFGELTPNTVQFFQPFEIKDDTCVWELF